MTPNVVDVATVGRNGGIWLSEVHMVEGIRGLSRKRSLTRSVK
jgi:hypothetical protein